MELDVIKLFVYIHCMGVTILVIKLIVFALRDNALSNGKIIATFTFIILVKTELPKQGN